MNPVTFNDPFERLLRTPHLDARLRPLLNITLKSPLLRWDYGESGITEGVIDAAPKSINGFPRLPFNCFRADYSMGQADGYVMNLKTVVWSKEPLVTSFTSITSITSKNNFWSHLIKGGIIIWAALDEAGNRSFRLIYPDGSYVTDPPPPEAQKLLHGASLGALACIAADFANPHFHMTHVSPPPRPGRSLQWIKAREHFVLIHKSHPANKREALGDRPVIDGKIPERSAHCRRAHFRMLRSPRFRHKMGVMVWVKSSWVGPKEWTDRSGQIYKIL